jgi:hypothetical protein
MGNRLRHRRRRQARPLLARTAAAPVREGATPKFAAIEVADDTPLLNFHQVPEGKTVKNRMHPDLVSTEFDSDVERLLGLSATPLNDLPDGSAHWITFADPERNEFDLIASRRT